MKPADQRVACSTARLTSSDVCPSKWQAAGKITKVLAKVKHNRRRQLGRGRACLRCRSMKSRCDGERPCSKCTQAGYASDCLHNGAAPQQDQDATVEVEAPSQQDTSLMEHSDTAMFFQPSQQRPKPDMADVKFPNASVSLKPLLPSDLLSLLGSGLQSTGLQSTGVHSVSPLQLSPALSKSPIGDASGVTPGLPLNQPVLGTFSQPLSVSPPLAGLVGLPGLAPPSGLQGSRGLMLPPTSLAIPDSPPAKPSNKLSISVSAPQSTAASVQALLESLRSTMPPPMSSPMTLPSKALPSPTPSSLPSSMAMKTWC